MNPLHPIYEILAKEIVYGFDKPEFSQAVNLFLNQAGYEINKTFVDPATGLQALGLTAKQSDKPPVLVFRGLDEPIDDATAVEPTIGLSQFAAGRDEIAAWLAQVSAGGIKPDVIGHSLGGPIAQITAAEFTNQVGEIVTFNSPGTSQTIADQFLQNGGAAKTVTHYIVKGDLVSLAGEEFIAGKAILQAYTDPALNPVYALDKHRVINRLLSQPPVGQGFTQSELSVQKLSSPLFTYQNDSDYTEFLADYATINPAQAALLTTRAGTETLRNSPGFSFLGAILGARDLVALSQDNLLTGDSANNTADAAAGNDTVFGFGGDDTLNGGAGQDQVFGNGNDDRVSGGAGSDRVSGGLGNDWITGVEPNATLAGRGELDVLTGGLGNDRFVLGNAAQAFYDDRQNSTLGWLDFGLITDFGRKDVIQLHGKSQDYLLKTAPASLPLGTAIYLKTADKNELIGIVAGNSNLNLNSAAFAFVS